MLLVNVLNANGQTAAITNDAFAPYLNVISSL